MAYDYVPIQGKEGNFLSHRILEVSEFKRRYKKKLEELIETLFTVDYMKNKIEPLHQVLRPNLLNDPYKNRKIDKYDKEPEFIYQFIKDRSTYIKEQISKFD
jgi:spore coat protein H